MNEQLTNPQLVVVSHDNTCRPVVDQTSTSLSSNASEPVTAVKPQLAFPFAVDQMAWRQMVSWAWHDKLRDGCPTTVNTVGADLQSGDVVMQSLTYVLYKLIRPLRSNTAAGRPYTLWDVQALNTPKCAPAVECFYAANIYRLFVEG